MQRTVLPRPFCLSVCLSVSIIIIIIINTPVYLACRKPKLQASRTVKVKWSKCRFVERDYVTPNALTFRMSGEQIRLQFPPKLFRVNSWIAQMIRQWIPDCCSGDRKCTGPKSAAANSRNWQLVTSGRSQMLATRNFRDWHTCEVWDGGRSRRHRWTVAASLYCTRWGRTSQCRSWRISRDTPRIGRSLWPDVL